VLVLSIGNRIFLYLLTGGWWASRVGVPNERGGAMGAEQFETEANGKDVKEAFRHAVDGAFYDYGHAGYTGTICEKDSAYLIPRPSGMRARNVKDVIVTAQGWNSVPHVWPGQKPEYAAKAAEARTASKEAFQKIVKWFGHDEAEKIVNMSDDKWDSAIAIELTDDEQPKNDGERWFLFFGWASS